MINQAQQKLAAGKQQLAYEQLLEATDVDPGNQRTWLALAKAATSLAERRACLEEVIRLRPDSGAADEARKLLNS